MKATIPKNETINRSHRCDAGGVAALDEGSLAAAGRRLARSPGAVTRAINSWETHLGSRILRPILDAFLDGHVLVQARLLLLDRPMHRPDEGRRYRAADRASAGFEPISIHLGDVRRVV